MSKSKACSWLKLPKQHKLWRIFSNSCWNQSLNTIFNKWCRYVHKRSGTFRYTVITYVCVYSEHFSWKEPVHISLISVCKGGLHSQSLSRQSSVLLLIQITSLTLTIHYKICKPDVLTWHPRRSAQPWWSTSRLGWSRHRCGTTGRRSGTAARSGAGGPRWTNLDRWWSATRSYLENDTCSYI